MIAWHASTMKEGHVTIIATGSLLKKASAQASCVEAESQNNVKASIAIERRPRTSRQGLSWHA